MRTNGSICRMSDNNSWVIPDLILSPVLIPGIVHTETSSVLLKSIVFPLKNHHYLSLIVDGLFNFPIYLLTTGIPSSEYSEKFSFIGDSTLYWLGYRASLRSLSNSKIVSYHGKHLEILFSFHTEILFSFHLQFHVKIILKWKVKTGLIFGLEISF